MKGTLSSPFGGLLCPSGFGASRCSLKFCLPKSVQVAVFIDCYRSALAGTYLGFGTVSEVEALSSVLSFHIYETDVVFRSHWMRDASDFYLHSASIKKCHHRNMLFVACIHCVRYQFFHLFSAAYYRDLRVYEFLNDIAAMTASVKFCCHSLCDLFGDL